MNALLALALMASPCRAGVVMPVEAGVAPVGPAAGAAPVMAPAAGSLGAPSLGSDADLRGTLPLLPSPVPGLLGPAMNFIGEKTEAAAVRPETGAVRSAPAAAKAASGRVADSTPALPAKPSAGAPSLAISPDREPAALTPGNEAPLEPARPEEAAGLGRSFFDQSGTKDRGTLEDPSFPASPEPIIAVTTLESGAFRPVHRGRGRLALRDAQAAFGPGHGAGRGEPSYVPEDETFRDAVASAAGPVAPGGGAVMFRPAGPDGEASGVRAAELPSAAALPVLGAPRPLVIDLSGSGLIVSVRSALSGVLSPAPSAPELARPAPGPSTALLERGAMLEAFSVARDHAARASAQALSGTPAGRAMRRANAASTHRLEAAPEPSTAPLWWAWLVLPLLVAAFRGVL